MLDTTYWVRSAGCAIYRVDSNKLTLAGKLTLTNKQSLVQRFSTTRQSSSRPLCSRTNGWFGPADISLDTLATRRVSHVEPWRMKGFCYDLSLLQHSKSSTLAEELKQLALERLECYADLRPFFTDGSKGAESVGCAFVSGTTSTRFRLLDTTSIFTAELYAIYQVLKHIRRHNYSRCLIVTDSASSVMALRGQMVSSSLVLKTLPIPDQYPRGKRGH